MIVYIQARRKSGAKGMDIIPDTPLRALGRLLWAKLKNGERYVSVPLVCRGSGSVLIPSDGSGKKYAQCSPVRA